MIELVCQHQVEPASLREQLRQRGAGIHHMAYFVEDLDREAARLDSLGYPQAMVAATASGRRFAFHDGVDDLGHLLEIYELDEGLGGFYRMVAEAAEGWTAGTRSGPADRCAILSRHGAAARTPRAPDPGGGRGRAGGP
jgi:hypothetical protein